MARQDSKVEQRARKKTVVVAGDLVVDHYIYKGTRDKPYAPSKQGTVIHQETGGARLLFRILQKVGPASDEPFAVKFGMVSRSARTPVRSYALLTPCPGGEGREGDVWRVTGNLGYGDNASRITRYAQASARAGVDASVVVLDDAALGFRDGTNEPAWPQEMQKGRSADVEWVLLKTCAPVAQGDLWRRACQEFRDRLIVVVSASDLRREEVSIAEGLSWERSAQDLLRELTLNKSISDLTKCRHLIICLGTDGAMWVRTESDGTLRYRLVFDPGGLEGAWTRSVRGQVWGGLSCLAAAIVKELTKSGPDGVGRDASCRGGGEGQPDIGAGIVRGLSAMRRLLLVGHGAAGAGGRGEEPGFPLDEVVRDLGDPSSRYRIADVPEAVAAAGRSKEWTIISGEQRGGVGRPLYGLARRVALFGSKALVHEVPYARFGKLLAVDRVEIESLRGLERLVRSYEGSPRVSKPLSIAVFGAPGSGKSFSVKQIAAKALGKDAPILEFNLSQFPDPGELIGAFHQVRDKVLGGTTPVVFWDEFDSREYMWLQYFLSPMQDGKFQEGQVTHPIGKCVFVFAGGTSHDFASFSPREGEIDRFKLAKGPDFVSRLSGYLNVAGPNERQRDDAPRRERVDDDSPPDVTFPVRRALLMRVAAGFEGPAEQDEMDVDSGLLTAFLEVGGYAHGARSLETIIGLVRSSGLPGFRRSALPPEDQLSLHVDYDEFMGLVDRDRRFKMDSESLAPAVHEFYRELAHKKGWSVPFDMEFEVLPDGIKADNVAAAARIPRVLALVSLAVVSGDNPATAMTRAYLDGIIEGNLELLAEGEHDGWMEQKYRDGWSYSVDRDDKEKKHPCLVQYSNLGEDDKGKDRNSVRHFPDIVELAGYKIV